MPKINDDFLRSIRSKGKNRTIELPEIKNLTIERLKGKNIERPDDFYLPSPVKFFEEKKNLDDLLDKKTINYGDIIKDTVLKYFKEKNFSQNEQKIITEALFDLYFLQECEKYKKEDFVTSVKKEPID